MIDRIVAAALGSVAAAAIVAAGVQTVRLNAAQHTLADLRVAIAEEHEREAREAAAASEAAREVERLRQATMKGIVDEAEDRSRSARVGAAAARAAGDGLRLRAAAAGAACHQAASDTSVAAGGPPAPDYAELLAGVLSRLGDRAVELAAVADARGIAGQACEQAYDALNASPQAVEPIRN